MDNDFVRALTDSMMVDNERMWDRIFKRIQNISLRFYNQLVWTIRYALIGSLFAFNTGLSYPVSDYLDRLLKLNLK